MYFPNAASGNEWNRMATLSIRFYSLHLRCIVHCINSSYSKYSLLKKASETSVKKLFKFDFVELKVRKCFSTTDCTDYTDF